MRSLLTDEDSGGTRYLRAGAIPLVIAAIAVPVVVAMLVSVVAIEATAVGMAAGAAAVATLLFLAARLRPRGRLEVAASGDTDRRLLVVATDEVGPEQAERIASVADEAADVRLVVPVPSRRLDRWLSAEDSARREAERRLAHSAGTLVAAGLPVSGSLGDSDASQALVDELRNYSADEVILVASDADRERLRPVLERLDVPYEFVT